MDAMRRHNQNPSGVFAFFLLWSLLVLTPLDAFQTSLPPSAVQRGLISSGGTSLCLKIGGWFSRDRKKRQENDAESLGGVASIVDSMGDLKTAQRVGQLTDSLVKELAATVVEGSSAEGKVKVSFDCQQKPVNVQIDEGFLAESDAASLSTAVTTAMQDAHSKSIERMDEKMKSLYSELGLSQAM
jgi:DNA-binding YbaB/EbfC family protein